LLFPAGGFLHRNLGVEILNLAANVNRLPDLTLLFLEPRTNPSLSGGGNSLPVRFRSLPEGPATPLVRVLPQTVSSRMSRLTTICPLA
jgi:hypothetical protein